MVQVASHVEAAVSRRTKLVLTTVVLLLGIGLAWHFRKAGDAPPSGVDKSPVLSASHSIEAETPPSTASKTAPAETANSADSPTARLVGASPLKADSVKGATGAMASTTTARNDDRVPSLSPSFPGSDRRTTVDGSPLGLPSGLGALGPSTPMHRIADGDTLAQLAAHYLGSADRWRELYDYNRDVLMNPELLPIGAELRIPTAPFRPAEGGEGAGARSERNAAPAVPGADNQVATARPVSQPLDGATKEPARSKATTVAAENGAEPKVRLKLQRLPPFPADGPPLRVAPRTYIVQRGDTLNSIAEHVYGDGVKETILLEANRNIVATAQDVRPGMVLVVPADPVNGTTP